MGDIDLSSYYESAITYVTTYGVQLLLALLVLVFG